MRLVVFLLCLGCALGFVSCSKHSVVFESNAASGRTITACPAVSPDGSRIAFVSNRHAVGRTQPLDFEIYVARSDGTDLRRLTRNDAFESGVCWSPDGRRLAYETDLDGHFDIFTMNVDGTAVANLTASPANERGPDWSPDGTRIAFSSDRDGDPEIYVMDLERGSTTRLTFDHGHDATPRWSPRGDRIAFVSSRDGNDEIYVMAADGSDPRRLTFDDGSSWGPRWTGDGSRLLFLSGDAGGEHWALKTMRADGSNVCLARDSVDSGGADWFPDGRHLVYGGLGGEGCRLFASLDDGSAERPMFAP